ncbi:unnamed protein product [Cuscuta epithymum]|uniref:Uncharacterized protein n=1 Tax=Cuscuta epithymum TaxID=186058 RepID=A0AAV0DI37_9ASTE|nr:unnamed protein product [Cuscuta epithymum]
MKQSARTRSLDQPAHKLSWEESNANVNEVISLSKELPYNLFRKRWPKDDITYVVYILVLVIVTL